MRISNIIPEILPNRDSGNASYRIRKLPRFEPLESAQADFVPFVAAERTQFATDRRVCSAENCTMFLCFEPLESAKADFVPFVAAVSNRRVRMDPRQYIGT